MGAVDAVGIGGAKVQGRTIRRHGVGDGLLNQVQDGHVHLRWVGSRLCCERLSVLVDTHRVLIVMMVVANLGAEEMGHEVGDPGRAEEAGHLLETPVEHALREDGELGLCSLDEALEARHVEK